MHNKTLKVIAYEYIKNKITTCQLMPGDYLDEKSLISEIGASRTPIREALNKLEQENLVTIISKKGIVVSLLTADDIIEVFEIRQLVEPYVIKNFGNKLDIIKIKEFYENFLIAIENKSYEELLELDNNLHIYLISISKNKYLIDLMEKVNLQNQRFRIISGVDKKRIEIGASEHLDLLNNLINKDYCRAEKTIEKHLKISKKSFIENFNNLNLQ